MELEKICALMRGMLAHAPWNFGMFLDEEGYAPICDITREIQKQERFHQLQDKDIMRAALMDLHDNFEIKGQLIRAKGMRSFALEVPERMYALCRKEEMEDILLHGLPLAHHKGDIKLYVHPMDGMKKLRQKERFQVVRVNTRKMYEDGIRIYASRFGHAHADQIASAYLSAFTGEIYTMALREQLADLVPSEAGERLALMREEFQQMTRTFVKDYYRLMEDERLGMALSSEHAMESLLKDYHMHQNAYMMMGRKTFGMDFELLEKAVKRCYSMFYTGVMTCDGLERLRVYLQRNELLLKADHYDLNQGILQFGKYTLQLSAYARSQLAAQCRDMMFDGECILTSENILSLCCYQRINMLEAGGKEVLDEEYDKLCLLLHDAKVPGLQDEAFNWTLLKHDIVEILQAHRHLPLLPARMHLRDLMLHLQEKDGWEALTLQHLDELLKRETILERHGHMILWKEITQTPEAGDPPKWLYYPLEPHAYARVRVEGIKPEYGCEWVSLKHKYERREHEGMDDIALQTYAMREEGNVFYHDQEDNWYIAYVAPRYTTRRRKADRRAGGFKSGAFFRGKFKVLAHVEEAEVQKFFEILDELILRTMRFGRRFDNLKKQPGYLDVLRMIQNQEDCEQFAKMDELLAQYELDGISYQNYIRTHMDGALSPCVQEVMGHFYRFLRHGLGVGGGMKYAIAKMKSYTPMLTCNDSKEHMMIADCNLKVDDFCFELDYVSMHNMRRRGLETLYEPAFLLSRNGDICLHLYASQEEGEDGE